MPTTVLWIDDEYNRYKDLVSLLEKKEVVFEFADSLISAREKLKEIEKYDAIILDIIIPKGRDYREEELSERGQDPEYWGLVLLEELALGEKKVPKIVILTIVEDPRALSQINSMIKKKGVVSDILRKGMLRKQDVYQAVNNALDKPL